MRSPGSRRLGRLHPGNLRLLAPNPAHHYPPAEGGGNPERDQRIESLTKSEDESSRLRDLALNGDRLPHGTPFGLCFTDLLQLVCPGHRVVLQEVDAMDPIRQIQTAAEK
jgi:hypothetical protein